MRNSPPRAVDARVERLEPRLALSTAGDGPPHALGVRMVSDVVYSARGHGMDVFIPSGDAPVTGRPMVLTLEGGGWRWTKRAPYENIVADALLPQGYVVAGADYTYADGSTHPWPTNVVDVQDAVRWLRRHASDLGGDPNKIAIMGESSGGHLAAMAAYSASKGVTLNRNDRSPRLGRATTSAEVQAVVDFYGPSDLPALWRDSPRVRPYLIDYLGGPPAKLASRYRAASPINYVTPKSPPTLILQGMMDPTVVPSQSEELDAALHAAGVPHQLVEIPRARHGFKFAAAGQDLHATVIDFLDSALHQERASARLDLPPGV